MEAPFESGRTTEFPMTPTVYRVGRVRCEAAGVRTLHLHREDGGGTPDFTPGQFNMLYAFGVGEAAISIAGRAGTRRALVHTIRAAGPTTQALCRLRRGAALGLRGPFGSGWPLAKAAGKDLLLIAGGVGLPPLMSAVTAILNERLRFRNVSLLLGARTPDLLLYKMDLQRLADRRDLHLAATVDRATPGWQGPVGLVTALIQRAPFAPDNTIALLCGPEVMMRFTVRELQRRGVPESEIYLSLERNMKCAIAQCGHCQFGPTFVCREGPVFRCDRIRRWLDIPEL